jgi:hypothetical protein
MVDEVLAGAALLTLMGLRSEGEGACEQVAVDVGLVGLDLCDQLVDEVLMTLLSFDYGHEQSVLRAFPDACPQEGGGQRRTWGPCSDAFTAGGAAPSPVLPGRSSR